MTVFQGDQGPTGPRGTTGDPGESGGDVSTEILWFLTIVKKKLLMLDELYSCLLNSSPRQLLEPYGKIFMTNLLLGFTMYAYLISVISLCLLVMWVCLSGLFFVI